MQEGRGTDQTRKPVPSEPLFQEQKPAPQPPEPFFRNRNRNRRHNSGGPSFLPFRPYLSPAPLPPTPFRASEKPDHFEMVGHSSLFGHQNYLPPFNLNAPPFTSFYPFLSSFCLCSTRTALWKPQYEEQCMNVGLVRF